MLGGICDTFLKRGGDGFGSRNPVKKAILPGEVCERLPRRLEAPLPNAGVGFLHSVLQRPPRPRLAVVEVMLRWSKFDDPTADQPSTTTVLE